MQSIRRTKTDRSLKLLTGIVLTLAASLLGATPPSVFAGTYLNNRTNRLETSAPGATGRNLIQFTITDLTQPVGSLRFEFCDNDPIPNTPCNAPPGFNASGVTISQQVGEIGFSVHPNSTINDIILTRLPLVPTTGNVTYELSGITNPSFTGSYFIRLYTYSSTDASGVNIQEGGIALSTNDQFVLSSEVPPYLRLCAAVTISGFDCSSASVFFINLGEFSSSTPTTATSQVLAATNAANGYAITLGGTTLTSGNNVIPGNVAPSPSVTGISQFGINLRANTVPSVGAEPVGPGTATPTSDYNTPNLFKFVQGDAIASSSSSTDNRKYTISYVTNINSSQQPGIYATTISFICLANF